MRNLNHIFDRYHIGKIYGGDFAKLCSLLRIYELFVSLRQLFQLLLYKKIFESKEKLETPQLKLFHGNIGLGIDTT